MDKRLAFRLGQRIAMQKRALESNPTSNAMLGMGAGGLMGAALGPLSTMREEMRAGEYGTPSEQRKLKLKRQLRALLFGTAGAAIGGMIPGMGGSDVGLVDRLKGGLSSLGRGARGYGAGISKLLEPVTGPLAEGYSGAELDIKKMLSDVVDS